MPGEGQHISIYMHIKFDLVFMWLNNNGFSDIWGGLVFDVVRFHPLKTAEMNSELILISFLNEIWIKKIRINLESFTKLMGYPFCIL